MSTQEISHAILMHMFGRPKGGLGRLGGIIMARMNRKVAAWAIDLLAVHPEMVCIAEHIFQDGEWGILEWRDPSDLRPL